MLSAKLSLLVCLGASLSVLGDRLSLWAKMSLIGGAWLLTGGAHTAKIIIKTLPRDVRAVVKIVRLVFHVKRAERKNLTVPKMFAESVRKFPDKILFYFKDEEWTFRQVEDYSNRIANYFSSTGLSKGDSVALFMSNRPEFVCMWLGLSKIGVVPALINTNLRCDPLYHSVSVVKCKAIIFTSELAQAVETIFGMLMDGGPKFYPCYSLGPCNIPSAVDLNVVLPLASPLPVSEEISNQIGFKDKLLYIYTSGTTGLPKAAVIKHSRYILAGGGLTIMMGVKKTDRVYCPLPLYHSVGGMISLSGCMHDGIPMIMREKFSASSYWKDCVKYQATTAQYIGEICRYLLNTPESEYESQHAVRLMFGNGLRPEIWTDFTERFNIPNISEFYGSTEGNSQVLNFDNTVGAVGFVPVLFSSFLPLGLIKVNEAGEAVRDPGTGLCIRCKAGEPGEFVGIIEQNHPLREFNGYSDKTSSQKKVLYDVWRKGDSCFRSGDILVADDHGYLYFKDRKGDTFRWKGENVSTAEVEGVISRAAQLTDCVVYGVRVPNCEGRVGMAAIVEDLGAAPAAGSRLDLNNLAAQLNARLPAYARPIFLRIVRELDMTGTFKLKKRELQAEAFDINTIKDRLYLMRKGEYVPLSEQLYQNILSGKERF